MSMLLVALPFYRSLASIFDEQSVVNLVNKDRTERNIAPLAINEKLSRSAKDKAQDMISKNYFAHVSPEGITPWQWFEKNGYDYIFAGENLAINFTSAEDQQLAWMNSESHKKNILNEKYKEIGVAVVAGNINGKQTTITVQEFGTEARAIPQEKSIAGFSMTKATVDSMNIKADKYIDINAVEKIPAIILKKMSPVPLIAFLYVSLVMILFVFFAYEVMHGHVHFSFHHFSLHKKEIPISLNNNTEHLEHEIPEEMDMSLNLEKFYITHMKMRN